MTAEYTDIPDDVYVEPESLQDDVAQIIRFAHTVESHGSDSDDPNRLAHLLADLREAKQAVNAAYSEVELALMSAMGNQGEIVVDGIGVVVRHKVTRRKAWKNEELLDTLRPFFLYDLDTGESLTSEDTYKRIEDVFGLQGSKARIARLRDLLASAGRSVDEYCHEEDGGFSLELPARDLEDRAW